MDEVAAIVRNHDKNRYLASLFAPEQKRPHLLALYAFNAEITRIAASVSEAHLAEIRLQWWLDTLDGIYFGDAQAHPVAKALAEAVKAGDIPKYALANLAKAHQFDFYSDPMPSLHDLEGYLGETESALIKMAAMILDQDAALECGEAAGYAGVAYGLTQVLNHLPTARALKQCFLPHDLLAKRQITPDQIYAPDSQAALMVVVAELREVAGQRMEQFRKALWTVKNSAAPAFLHVALAPALLVQVRKRGAAVAQTGCDISQLRKQWLLWKAAKSEFF